MYKRVSGLSARPGTQKSQKTVSVAIVLKAAFQIDGDAEELRSSAGGIKTARNRPKSGETR